jgi:TRAP-type mannitol/chloroaromatic compound transport system permease large subunit
VAPTKIANNFVEISLIIVPIFYPIALSLGIDMQWFAILIAMNLQTSFLTPPFGFSLFYLKGVAPKSIQTTDIYKGNSSLWRVSCG